MNLAFKFRFRQGNQICMQLTAIKFGECCYNRINKADRKSNYFQLGMEAAFRAPLRKRGFTRLRREGGLLQRELSTSKAVGMGQQVAHLQDVKTAAKAPPGPWGTLATEDVREAGGGGGAGVGWYEKPEESHLEI